MIFNSWQFLVFFPLVATVYFVLTMRLKSNTLSQLFLLAASLFFYACWNPLYLVLLLTSVAVTWTSGILMEGGSRRGKRNILIGSLVINLAILFFFKYYGFFTGSVQFAAGRLFGPGDFHFPAFNVLLPVGISFYTFQALGYSIDVFYGRVKAERNCLTYALFVTFFPQLVAGPIERSGNLLPQFKANHTFDYDRVAAGLKRAAWGMFKKVVIADKLAVYVNMVYGDPSASGAAALALATFFFTFQIYCDFSGYSDIAIGCAEVMGFKLMDNFRSPYFSRSIADFWRRWHISLSAWLKDYVYIPLGGNRKGAPRRKLNIMITFLLSGLWHGAAWHFVVWGGLHGLYQIIERAVANTRKAALPVKSLPVKIIQVVITFTLVSFAWIFFRAASVSDALLIITKLTSLPAELAGIAGQIPAAGLVNSMMNVFQIIEENLFDCGISFLCILLLVFVDVQKQLFSGVKQAVRGSPIFRYVGYALLIFTIFLNWRIDPSQFIYFSF